MKCKFNFFYLLVSCFFLLLSINSKYIIKVSAEENLRIDLNEELKKGNFLVGLKQHLGGENDNFSEQNNISFYSDKGYLNLASFNGIKHKSKKFKIIWKNLSLQNPYVLKRIVFGPYASYESAKKQASNLREKGFQAIVAYPKNWEVWSPYEDNLFQNESNYKVVRKIFHTQITPVLSSEYTFQKLEGPIYISSDEEITINNISYGKEFYLIQDLYGTWTLIQKIKFDKYLEGVLPHEIGPNSPLEALKAQAVIARTWGIYNSERFNMDKYHLCITTQCQVYKVPKTENKNIKKAIKETSDLIVTYKDKPINAFYHGSNGGISALSNESWQIQNLPYFQTIIDGSKSIDQSIKFPFIGNSELNKFLNLQSNEFYGSNHSLFRWNKNISSLLIKESLIKKKLINENDNLLNISVIERGSSGRVTKLKIKLKNSEKSIVITKDNIRRIFSFLPSNLFTINKLNDNLWLFKGGGFGHGVGLSQSGAIEMAELGFTHEQILNHYYRDTKLQKIKILSQ